MTMGQFAAPLVMLPAYYFSLPLFAGLVGASVVGAGRVFVRARRREEEVRELARNARVGEARALPGGAPSSAPRGSSGGAEAEIVGAARFESERMGRAYLRIEVPHGDGSFTVRLVRDRPRGFSTVAVEGIPVLFAPHSNIVIAFDTRGEMLLGAVELAPLPKARRLRRGARPSRAGDR